MHNKFFEIVFVWTFDNDILWSRNALHVISKEDRYTKGITNQDLENVDQLLEIENTRFKTKNVLHFINYNNTINAAWI